MNKIEIDEMNPKQSVCKYECKCEYYRDICPEMTYDEKNRRYRRRVVAKKVTKETMTKDEFENMRKRVIKAYKEEEAIKKSKQIVILDVLPETKHIIIPAQKMKKRKINKFKVLGVNNPKNIPKVNKIVEYIENEFIKITLHDKMDLYKDCVDKVKVSNDQQAYETLQRFSKMTKIDIGKLHNIQGEFHETEDPLMEKTLERLSKLYI